MDQKPVNPPIPIEVQIKRARDKVAEKFKKYYEEVLKSKVLESNMSEGAKRTQKAIIDDLVKACVELENLNVSEGLVALAVSNIRMTTKLKDRINYLEYQVELLKRDMKKLIDGKK